MLIIDVSSLLHQKCVFPFAEVSVLWFGWGRSSISGSFQAALSGGLGLVAMNLFSWEQLNHYFPEVLLSAVQVYLEKICVHLLYR